MPYYINPIHNGLSNVHSEGNGQSISLRWNRALPNVLTNQVAYNIYYSTNPGTLFSEGPKFVSFGTSNNATINDLTPGQLYQFAVRAVEYNPLTISPSLFFNAYDNLYIFPESVLSEDMTATQLFVPLVSSETFPSSGIVLAGVELISYIANDQATNQLILAGGTLPTNARLYQYPDDGYYQASSNNVGSGIITNLEVINSNAPAENWTIKCIAVQRDTSNNPIAGTAKFQAVGTISGNPVNNQGDFYTWDCYGTVQSNGIISFGVQEEAPPAFDVGDSFVLQVIGAIPGTSPRGYNGTVATEHLVSGFDGYQYWNPYIRYIIGEEEQNTVSFECQSRFDVFHEAFTLVSGYKQVTENYLQTDLIESDEYNVGFPRYDFVGYHRTDPIELLNGGALNTYFGGSQYCADGYGGVGRQLRGLSLQYRNDQRQEVLLSITGSPMCLLQRQWTGIVCSCYIPASEFPDDRCTRCFGTKYIIGWNQYFNPRRSDGRIMVRFSPTEEDLKPYEAGLESEFIADAWTLTVPSVFDRDVLVGFTEDGVTEDFRYEILSVNRNRTISQLEGAQKFRVQRVRKFDPIYTIPVFRDTKYFPQTLTTTVSSALGIPAHSHTIQLNENITSISQISQLTGTSFGHNHPIVNGVFSPEILHHTHEIILPPSLAPTKF
jgi:hypothetical protein